MNSKTTGIIVVILIIVLGLWLALRKSGDKLPEAPYENTSSDTTQAPVDSAAMVAGISASGSSDAALQQDAATIDSELQAFSSDNAAAQSDQ